MDDKERIEQKDTELLKMIDYLQGWKQNTKNGKVKTCEYLAKHKVG